MPVFWISLPSSWQLEDVTAALNVVVTVLSALCIFVFARACWQKATAHVAKNRNVPLAGLLSVNTLGEVIDVVRLLGVEILSSYYLRILAQCIVVTGLTVVAFASGPIVRYSTKWGTKLALREVPVLKANRYQSGISHESVLWNTTWESLDQAKFPYNQLPDFLPNASAHWEYVASQWDNAWEMDCKLTESTAIALTVVETPCNENTTLNDQIPALESIFPSNHWWTTNNTWTYSSSEGFNNDKTKLWKDVLQFRTAYTKIHNDSADIWENLEITLMSMHLKGLKMVPWNEIHCSYSPGPVDSATYTKAVCKINKIKTTMPDEYFVNISYPDSGSQDFPSLAMTQFFQGQYSRDVIAKSDYRVITPQDLVRFYQVYQITQATQLKYPETRVLNVELKVVKLSTIFVTTCTLASLACIFGILRYGVFTLRNYKAVDRTPQSKLDWMLQSIEKSQAGTPLIPSSNVNPRRHRHSVTSLRSPDLSSPISGRRRSDFETATYGNSPEPSTPYHMNWLSRESSGGSYFPIQEHPELSDASLLERYPSAPAGPLGQGHGLGFGDYQIHR